MFHARAFQSAVDETKPNLYHKETLKDLVKYAETQDKDTVHQLELQVYPPKFATVTVDSNKKLHTKITTDSNAKSYPRDSSEVLPIAYKWHTEDIVRVGRVYDYNEFCSLFDAVNTKIDKAIEVHHGIPCGVPIDQSGRRGYESIILHFIDVLICKLSEIESKPKPNMRITSPSFSSIPDGMLITLFDNDEHTADVSFNDEEKWFVFRNADIYYHIYGYWHNYSNKPIRLSCESLSGLRRSKSIQQDDIHLRHQEVKFNELKRKCQGDHVKGLYLVT